MKRNIIGLLIAISVLLIIICCSDSAKKVVLGDSQMRVEYSNCTGCQECINDFSCPENAFTIDERTGTVYIDTDRCTNCMKCVQEFQCPDNAITIVQDNISPAGINDLQATSDEIGVLNIEFTAVGDDSLMGNAYRYELTITDENGNVLAPDYIPLPPALSGTIESWVISGMPVYETVNVHLEVFDEMEHTPGLTMATAIIQGEFIDDIPPAGITDLEAVSGEEFIILNWTATGDDGYEGSAVSYVIRYSLQQINSENWESAEILENNLVPAVAGSVEMLEIANIDLGVEYHFAIKAIDNEGLISAISNSVPATLWGDQTAPATITDAEFITPGLNSLVLKWSAVGDNETEGIASSYLIKYNIDEINESNWETSIEFINDIIPAVAGTIEQIQIDGLDPETQYFAAVVAIDDVGNQSQLSNVAVGVTQAIPDTTPPSAIDDLSATTTEAEIILNWTATGDDGNEGTAFQYILKRSTENITEENWDTAETIEGVPAPLVSGSAETFMLTDCELNINYHFALKVRDDSDNYSALSNQVEAMLEEVEDLTPPAVISLEVVDEQVYNLTTMKLRWNAPGDDGDVGTATSYEIRYSTAPIDEEVWSSATVVSDPPAPEPAGTEQTFIVNDLNLATIYYFVIKSTDDSDNTSDISNNPAGKIVYQILTNQCHNCNQCINECPEGAIYQAGGYKDINPDLCVACGDCVSDCPWNLIRKWVVAY